MHLEKIKDHLTEIANEPYPCQGCGLWNHCRDTQEECKAFRNYCTLHGKFDLAHRAHHLRMPRNNM